MVAIIHSAGQHMPIEERKKLAIHYAVELYKKNGRLKMSALDRIVGRRVIESFGGSEHLIKEAGLPEDCIYGSGKCFFCGGPFRKKTDNAKFCSTKCQSTSSNRRRLGRPEHIREKVNCKGCGKLFTYMVDGGSSYCSDDCLKKTSSLVGNGVRRARKAGAVTVPYTREEILSRDGPECRHCGVQCRTEGSTLESDFLNLDHIIPISKGGHDAPYNIQVLCRSCNGKKGTKISTKDYELSRKMWPLNVEEIIRNAKVIDKAFRTSKSGVRGVYFSNTRNKWAAKIQRDNIRVFLCFTDHMDIAVRLRKEAVKLINSGVSINDIKEGVAPLWQTLESHKH